MIARSLLLGFTALVLATPVRAETLGFDYLALVMQHLYRWHLDETALIQVDPTGTLTVHHRDTTPELDDTDRSTYRELLIPAIRYRVLLKKADYDVPELGITITNKEYRIIKAERVDDWPSDLSGFEQVDLDAKAMMDYLFSVRNQRTYPDEALIERMRRALREHLTGPSSPPVQGPQTVYIAPLSRVSNNLWVYWENAGRLIRYSSDTDLDTEAFWAYEKLGVRVYDLSTDVVISFAEAAGSNAFVTRDWAARALFNCVVFGQRLVITPGEPVTTPAGTEAP